MRSILPTLLIAGGFFGARIAAADSTSTADWAQFRGPGGLASRPDARPPLTWSADENLAWKAELPGPGTSSPIVWKDRIYLTCYSGFGERGKEGQKIEDLKRHLLCLGLADGKPVWSQAVPARQREEERIREDHGYASSTPAADAQRVYVFFGASGALAFDHQGKELWRADVGSTVHGWGSAASPVLHGRLVFINASVESTSLVALDRETGKEVWRAPDIRDSWNTPLLVEADGGKTELVVAVMQKVLGFDPGSGERLWSCDTDIKWYMCPSAVAHRGVVYATGGRGGGGSLAVRAGGRGDVTAKHRLWRLGKGTNVPSPVYHDGHLYFAHDNLGILYCQDAATGNLVYEERIERLPGIYASPILAAGRIYYLARDGQAVVVAAKPAFEVLARNSLKDRGAFNASPALAGDRLLLRSDRFLYCVGEKAGR
jgi:outer membrane protein assembly factor BamB